MLFALCVFRKRLIAQERLVVKFGEKGMGDFRLQIVDCGFKSKELGDRSQEKTKTCLSFYLLAPGFLLYALCTYTLLHIRFNGLNWGFC